VENLVSQIKIRRQAEDFENNVIKKTFGVRGRSNRRLEKKIA